MKKILFSTLMIFTFSFAVHAAVPHTMSFQGKATDKLGAPLNGAVNMTFRIYNTETGGTAKWQETHDALPVTNGIFNCLLGSVQPLNLPFDEQYWVSIEINSDGEMSPRTKLASVGYAVRAETAEALSQPAVIPFYKKGFDIEGVDFNSVKVTPGVMDLAGRMFTSTDYSGALCLEYSDEPKNRDWVSGAKTANSIVYVYAYNNNGTIAFKFSNEVPDLYDQTGNTVGLPFVYRKYPNTDAGKYYRLIGKLALGSAGQVESIFSEGACEPPSRFSRFGGNAKDGDIVISEDTNVSTLTGGIDKYYIEARNFTVVQGKKLTVDTGWFFLAVKGKLTVAGIMTADGQGEAGGSSPGGNGAGAGEGSLMNICVSGAGGGGGYYAREPGFPGGNGGSAGGAGGRGGFDYSGNIYGKAGTNIKPAHLLALTGGLGNNIVHSLSLPIFQLTAYRGAGGGAGGGGGYTGAVGGAGGGVIYIECNILDFTGTLTANGQQGQNLLNSGRDYGSGGGGGGVIIVRVKNIISNSGIVSVSGGAAGGGGIDTYFHGAAGADGFKDIVVEQ